MTQMCRGGHPDLHIQPLMVVVMTLMVMMIMVVIATMAQMCCSHLDIQSRHSLMDGYEDFFYLHSLSFAALQIATLHFCIEELESKPIVKQSLIFP